jgi:hypothetical protein
LRRFLEGVLPKNSAFDDFEVELDFAGLGRKVLVFNARRLEQGADLPGMILLAIEEGKAPRGDAAPMAPK